MPVNAADFIDVSILGSVYDSPILTLTYEDNTQLSYFTQGAYNLNEENTRSYNRKIEPTNASPYQQGIDRTNAKPIGETQRNTGLSVRMDFDFLKNMASIQVLDKMSGSLIGTATNIPIDPSAINVDRIALAGQIQQAYKMGLDNVSVKLYNYSDDTIISLGELDNIYVTKLEWEDDYFNTSMPQTVDAVIAVNQAETTKLNIDSWTCNTFDSEVFGTYTWIGKVNEGSYVNSRNIDMTVELTMIYGDSIYAVSAENPPAVSLDAETITTLPAYPTSVKAVMSDGSTATMDIDQTTWKEKNGATFPTSGEQVYIYQANIKPTGNYMIKNPITIEWYVSYFSNSQQIYAVSAENPPAVSLDAEAITTLPAYPTSVKAVMSDGSTATMDIDQTTWKEKNGATFPTSGEQVYIYQANIKPTGIYTINNPITIEWYVSYFSSSQQIYAVSAENPPSVTLNADRISTLPAFPTSVRATMSNGVKADMDIDQTSWTEKNGATFPTSGVRTYVYQANLLPTGIYTIKDPIVIEWTVRYYPRNRQERRPQVAMKPFETPLRPSKIFLERGHWVWDGEGWWFNNTNNTYLYDGWYLIKDVWYLFGEDGYAVNGWVYDEDYQSWFYLDDISYGMVTGWLRDKKSGKWYYLNLDGSMLVQAMTPDGYYVDQNGVWIP